MGNENEQELLESLILELRRGTLVLAVLSQLNQPQYGYSLVVLLQEKGMNIEANTLYPLLRRLEKQGILLSSWDTEGTKPRKYYELSELGTRLYNQLKNTWNDMSTLMSGLINQ